MARASIREELGSADEEDYVFSIRVKRLLNLNLCRSGNITCVCLYKVLIDQ